MAFLIGVIIGFLAVAAAIRYRSRIAAFIPSRELTDDQIRAIEEEGRIEVEDPLDLDRIRDEETRFWEETWDEPDDP